MANGRYGSFAWGGRYERNWPVGAHRAAYELTHGPIPADQHVLHSCDTPLCVNPAHLSLGTRFDNMRDAARKGRLRTPRPARQKVTDRQVAEIRDAARVGARHRALAKAYGITPSMVSHIVAGKRRKVAA